MVAGFSQSWKRKKKRKPSRIKNKKKRSYAVLHRTIKATQKKKSACALLFIKRGLNEKNRK